MNKTHALREKISVLFYIVCIPPTSLYHASLLSHIKCQTCKIYINIEVKVIIFKLFFLVSLMLHRAFCRIILIITPTNALT